MSRILLQICLKGICTNKKCLTFIHKNLAGETPKSLYYSNMNVSLELLEFCKNYTLKKLSKEIYKSWNVENLNKNLIFFWFWKS